ncbi:Arm DNA-binding domain-containing protein [Microbacteriaceae bacterium K1510]|nr:Arm DNA-binding domain-containing protein [Microbacteriaceae bacterium K1510]
MYPDGGGLYLQVISETARSWIYRYRLRGCRREMGLGPLMALSLADARAVVKFEEDASQYIKARASGGRNPKHTAQWSTSLETYVFPAFGDIGVDDVTTTLVLKALEPI